MTDRQAFYNEIAQEKGLDPDDIEEALDVAIHFLMLRKVFIEFVANAQQEKVDDNTIGIHVRDTIKTVDRLR